jgi:hypothetical protein
MKKPILAVLGLAGACAACCSIPIALTLVSGLSAAGVASWVLGDPTAQIAVVGLAFLITVGIWVWRSRRAACSCATAPAVGCATSSTGGCGCATTANKPAGS